MQMEGFEGAVPHAPGSEDLRGEGGGQGGSGEGWAWTTQPGGVIDELAADLNAAHAGAPLQEDVAFLDPNIMISHVCKDGTFRTTSQCHLCSRWLTTCECGEDFFGLGKAVIHGQRTAGDIWEQEKNELLLCPACRSCTKMKKVPGGQPDYWCRRTFKRQFYNKKQDYKLCPLHRPPPQPSSSRAPRQADAMPEDLVIDLDDASPASLVVQSASKSHPEANNAAADDDAAASGSGTSAVKAGKRQRVAGVSSDESTPPRDNAAGSSPEHRPADALDINTELLNNLNLLRGLPPGTFPSVGLDSKTVRELLPVWEGRDAMHAQRRATAAQIFYQRQQALREQVQFFNSQRYPGRLPNTRRVAIVYNTNGYGIVASAENVQHVLTAWKETGESMVEGDRLVADLEKQFGLFGLGTVVKGEEPREPLTFTRLDGRGEPTTTPPTVFEEEVAC